METAPQNTDSAKTGPKDFFLWLGGIIALYGSITSFIALLFAYINYAYPDQLAGYGDPYGGAVRFSMAALIVLVPTTVVLFRLIRGTIAADAGKAAIWVRRWAIVLTLFIATVTILIDLITLVNTFLGGEVTVRFVLKVAVVLLVALGVFLHFLADLKGYWLREAKRANMVGIAVLIAALAAVVSGFLVFGSPTHVRMLKLDAQRVQDLQLIQSQVVTYWQQKQALPPTLAATTDSLGGYTIPRDPQTGSEYQYTIAGPTSFTLCAAFNSATPVTDGQGSYGRATTYPSTAGEDSWYHDAGNVCYTRTIDPDRYPPFKAEAATKVVQ